MALSEAAPIIHLKKPETSDKEVIASAIRRLNTIERQDEPRIIFNDRELTVAEAIDHLKNTSPIGRALILRERMIQEREQAEAEYPHILIALQDIFRIARKSLAKFLE
jgi:hypothetical protein